jgi:hypothetical protein
LNYQQKVFDRDTVMTDDSAEAVLSFADGGVINLGPSTLVELVSRETNPLDSGAASELILNVQKGEVSGISGTKKLRVQKDGKMIDLPKPKDGSLLAKVLEQDKSAMKTECQVKADLSNPEAYRFTKDGGLELTLLSQCEEEPESRSHVKIFDSRHQVLVSHQTLPARIKFPSPGLYTLMLEESLAPGTPLTIPAEWPGISFLDTKPSCGGIIRWKLDAANGNPSVRFLIESAKLPHPEPFEKPSATLTDWIATYPAQLRIRTAPNVHGFSWTSPLLEIKRAPACNELVYPKNQARLGHAMVSTPVVFTWKQKPEQDEVRYELSDSADFKKILNTQMTRHNYARVPITRPGIYFWRVVDVKSGEQSEVFQFKAN